MGYMNQQKILLLDIDEKIFLWRRSIDEIIRDLVEDDDSLMKI